MWRLLFCVISSVYLVTCLPMEFLTKSFNVGIEYEHSLPMSAGSERFRHRNNYDPFFVTVTATAKNGFVLDYLEVSATTDAAGEVDFCLVQGGTGSRNMVFTLSSNHSDFLAYTYRAYGIRQEEYNKVTNVLEIPMAPPFPSKAACCPHFLSHLLIVLVLVFMRCIY